MISTDCTSVKVGNSLKTANLCNDLQGEARAAAAMEALLAEEEAKQATQKAKQTKKQAKQRAR